MAAIALFRGRGHVMEWRNAEVLAIAPRDGLDAPVREQYPEPEYAETQAAMDECLNTGRPVMLSRPLGILVCVPRKDDRGRTFGVGTWFEVAASPRLRRLPPPRELLARSAAPVLALVAFLEGAQSGFG